MSDNLEKKTNNGSGQDVGFTVVAVIVMLALVIGLMFFLVNHLTPAVDAHAELRQIHTDTVSSAKNAVISTAATIEEMVDIQLSETVKLKSQIEVAAVTKGEEIFINVGMEEKVIPLPEEAFPLATSGDSDTALEYQITSDYTFFDQKTIIYNNLGGFIQEGHR